MRKIPRFRPRVVDEQWRRYWRKMERTQGTPVPGISKKSLKEQALAGPPAGVGAGVLREMPGLRQADGLTNS